MTLLLLFPLCLIPLCLPSPLAKVLSAKKLEQMKLASLCTKPYVTLVVTLYLLLPVCFCALMSRRLTFCKQSLSQMHIFRLIMFEDRYLKRTCRGMSAVFI